jgi:hypothetical protein
MLGNRIKEIATRYIAVASVALTASCVSYSYVDSRNVEHVIGFVDVALSPSSPGRDQPTPSAVKITTLGLSAFSATETGSLTLGFSQLTLLIVPDNSCIDLNFPGPCSSPANPAK